MNVFARRFYGFDPVTRPIVAFALEGDRDALIEASGPGDMIVFVGTMGEPTAEDDRGRLLGIAEFARIPVDTKEIIDPATYRPFDIKPDGSLIWPKALPILRAWAFNPKIKVVDALEE